MNHFENSWHYQVRLIGIPYDSVIVAVVRETLVTKSLVQTAYNMHKVETPKFEMYSYINVSIVEWISCGAFT